MWFVKMLVGMATGLLSLAKEILTILYPPTGRMMKDDDDDGKSE